MSTRGARQTLPREECEFLRVLIGEDLKARARALHDAGWSLAAIANAFDPPKQRSSVRAWVTAKSTPARTHTTPIPSPPSSSSSHSSSTITAAENLNPATSAPSSARPPRRVYDPDRPRVSPGVKKRISHLAPLARRYRARTPIHGTYARANAELTDICRAQYSSGASVRELALAAGVTYRAMARRLGR